MNGLLDERPSIDCCIVSEPRHLSVDGSQWPDPWPAVFELARAVSSDHWVLIGGLMVQLHHRLHGEVPTRATRDIDTLARVEVTWRQHLRALRDGLQALGYEDKDSIDASAPLHRMTRADGAGDMQVDFLIADHVPPPAEQDLPQPLPVQAPGGRNALERLRYVEVLTPQGPVVIAVPDLIGALELKIEAYRADSRDRERHLQDAVALAGLLHDAAPDPPLHGSAGTRLRRFLRWMNEGDRLAGAAIGRDEATDVALAVEDILQYEVDPDTRDGSGT
ncbi:MAG: nucleotidyl transferase AbiEii/AbiGii toxin family protein [Deinococcus sp.]|uniref:nucleotidyl transferase AbiEii/AbiGii toxin family protein n=1 Tax=Deinococcus sp. TaxID=47478 RepID=UPI0026DC7D52|nr:nucleotidyl transferase AbiEii/AbiGii toxin family protein [Deinococcus sp.]MDO4246188.1 nucleotidyl transferase AbiEii/AbiGii toxin family protein [Deinococcus sp.]